VAQGEHVDHHNVMDPTYGEVVGIVHLDVDDDLHRAAKSLAAQRGETLKAFVTRAIENEIDRAKTEAQRPRPRTGRT
jgi:predicted HicB family RNase H-like nuclease